jgi:hypothetical protein
MEQGQPIQVETVISICLEQLAELAWVKLGLVPDPIAKTIAKDLAQAKLAIDAVAALGGAIEGQLDDNDRRKVQGLIRDLRMNYVEKSKEGT